jgi:hypothetical protein
MSTLDSRHRETLEDLELIAFGNLEDFLRTTRADASVDFFGSK